MMTLNEDDDFVDQLKGERRDPLFFEGAHLTGHFNRYEKGYSSRPAEPEIEAEYQAWQLAPLGGPTHDEPGYFSDGELQRMVETTIKADPRLSSAEKRAIKVEVRNRRTTLSGTLQSQEAKDQVESDAYWTEGIGEVKNQIEVHAKA